MTTKEGKLADILKIGANVTIPTESWGTWTGDVITMNEPGPLAPEGTVFVTIRHEDGTEQEVRTNRNYTGYLNTPAPTTKTTDVVWATQDDGSTHGTYSDRAEVVVEVSAPVRPSSRSLGTPVREWAIVDHNRVIVAGTSIGLRAAKRDGVAALMNTGYLRVGTKVKVNADEPSGTHAGMTGRVESKVIGSDGRLYLVVELRNGEMWPFLIRELDRI